MAATPKKPAPKKATVVESGNKSGRMATSKDIKKVAPKPASKPNKLESLIQDVTNRYRVTAREARDIVTAAGTVAKTRNPKFVGDVVKQVKEVKTAATTGRKGTTAYTVSGNGKNANQKDRTDKTSTSVGVKGKLK